MEEILIELLEEGPRTRVRFTSSDGQTPELLGVLFDDLVLERTVWALTPDDPHFSHPLEIAFAHAPAAPGSPVMRGAVEYMGARFSRALPEVVFGIVPAGFVASQPDDAIGPPVLEPGHRYAVTAVGPHGIGCFEFTCAVGPLRAS